MEEMGVPVDEYGGTIYFTNFKLAEGSDLEKLNRAVNDLAMDRLDADFEANVFLDHLDRLHLHGENKGMIGYLINLILATVIMLIACINFINLTTASSSLRLKEIAIRKSTGATRRQLVIQFMSETYLLLMFALYLGFFIAEHLGTNVFRTFDVYQVKIEKGLGYWLTIVGIFLLTGLLAGLYPALKITEFKPLSFFTGKGTQHIGSGARSRRVLIVVQFAFSILFITASIFIVRQFTYMRTADLGFNRRGRYGTSTP